MDYAGIILEIIGTMQKALSMMREYWVHFEYNVSVVRRLVVSSSDHVPVPDPDHEVSHPMTFW